MKIIFILGLLLGSASYADENRTVKNESEAGLVITGGNTEVSTINFKQASTLAEGPNSYLLNARYLRSSNAGVEQALQWGLGLKYEHAFTERYGFFIGELVESNIYQSIFQRYSTDAGGKYFFHKIEKELVWFFEGGYRFSRENYLSSFKNQNFLRLYSEVEKYFGETMSGKLWIEYLPNITAWKAYQLNGSISLSTVISGIFSLKNAFELRYNDDPPVGAKSASDRIFTTALVAKF